MNSGLYLIATLIVPAYVTMYAAEDVRTIYPLISSLKTTDLLIPKTECTILTTDSDSDGKTPDKSTSPRYRQHRPPAIITQLPPRTNKGPRSAGALPHVRQRH